MNSETPPRPKAERLRTVLAIALWAFAAVQWLGVLVRVARPANPNWLLDWSVYYTAGQQLVARTLYQVPLAASVTLPIGNFNYGPMAALWAVPLLPLGRDAGGVVWIFGLAACLVVGLILAVRSLGFSHAWAWAAIVLVVYLTVWIMVDDELALGNDNDLMFALVAGFAAAHLSGRRRLAGILLGLAIATKVWPVPLLVFLLRERRWTTLRWCVGLLAVQGIAFLAWLGPGAVLPFLEGMVINGPRDTANVQMLWTSAARVTWAWWPWWGTYVVAAAFLAIPARGRLGLGLAIIGGLSLNANLWYHYIWSFAFGWALVAVGLAEIGVARFWPRYTGSSKTCIDSGATLLEA